MHLSSARRGQSNPPHLQTGSDFRRLNMQRLEILEPPRQIAYARLKDIGILITPSPQRSIGYDRDGAIEPVGISRDWVQYRFCESLQLRFERSIRHRTGARRQGGSQSGCIRAEPKAKIEGFSA